MINFLFLWNSLWPLSYLPHYLPFRPGTDSCLAPDSLLPVWLVSPCILSLSLHPARGFSKPFKPNGVCPSSRLFPVCLPLTLVPLVLSVLQLLHPGQSYSQSSSPTLSGYYFLLIAQLQMLAPSQVPFTAILKSRRQASTPHQVGELPRHLRKYGKYSVPQWATSANCFTRVSNFKGNSRTSVVSQMCPTGPIPKPGCF